ncbi:alpha/beta hydrolase [Metabacillus sp. SLBN-84]
MKTKQILLLILFAVIMIAFPSAPEASVSGSKTVVETISSKALKKDDRPHHHKLTYKLYLPEGYDKKRKAGYPVVYLLHGSGGNEHSWDDFFGTLDRMIAKKEIEPVIAVVPSSGNSYWVNSKKYGNYESAVIEDLIPHIDKKYNTAGSRSGRFLSGYSMGGYGALRYSLMYPDLFFRSHTSEPRHSKQRPACNIRSCYTRKLWRAF